MSAKSVYIIQTQVIGLGEMPFSLKGQTVETIRPIFESTDCFADLRALIIDPQQLFWISRKAQGTLSPPMGMPFIQDVGRIVFKTRSAMLSEDHTRAQLAENLAKCREYWKAIPDSDGFVPEAIYCFGYDHKLEDQRMNHMYFELYKPVQLSAWMGKTKMAGGHIYIHFIPSGFMVIHLAVGLYQDQLRDLKTMGKAIWETSPWRAHPGWKWKSSFAEGSLAEVVSALKEKISHSIAVDKTIGIPLRERPWYTSIRFDTTDDLELLGREIFHGDLKKVELRQTSRAYFSSDDPEGELMIAKHGLVCKPFQRNAATRRIFIWKLVSMVEFALVQDFVYQEYAKFLAEEITRLRDYRLSYYRKIKQEDMFKLSVYKSEIPRYLLALDDIFRYAPGFYKFVCLSVLEAIGHSKRHEHVKELTQAWIDEVEKWEHALVTLWKVVISPLRKVVGI